MAKTGKKFDVPFSHFYTVQNDKITKFRQYADTLQLRSALV
ncbi:MAG: hypothetical protein WAO91_10340 [Candidatus Nitrosotenuis sp.]